MGCCSFCPFPPVAALINVSLPQMKCPQSDFTARCGCWIWSRAGAHLLGSLLAPLFLCCCGIAVGIDLFWGNVGAAHRFEEADVFLEIRDYRVMGIEGNTALI